MMITTIMRKKMNKIDNSVQCDNDRVQIMNSAHCAHVTRRQRNGGM